MRQCIFFYYGWFLQNLEKGCTRTNMNTTVVGENHPCSTIQKKNPIVYQTVFPCECGCHLQALQNAEVGISEKKKCVLGNFFRKIAKTH